MRYRVTMSVAIEAVDDRQAHECAVKLSKLLKSPLVKMAVEGDGNPIVHQPLPERAMRA
jgi:hypothetical protein